MRPTINFFAVSTTSLELAFIVRLWAGQSSTFPRCWHSFHRYGVSSFVQLGTQLRVCFLLPLRDAIISDFKSGRYFCLSQCQLWMTLCFLPGFAMSFLFGRRLSQGNRLTHTYHQVILLTFRNLQDEIKDMDYHVLRNHIWNVDKVRRRHWGWIMSSWHFI